MRLYPERLTKILSVALAACFLMLPAAGAVLIRQGKTVLSVSFYLPKGYEFTQGAPFKLEWTTDKPGIVQFEKTPAKNFDPVAVFKIPLRTRSGSAVVSLTAVLYYCDKVSGLCFRDTFKTSIPVEVATAGSSDLLYAWHIKPKQRPANRMSAKK